MRPQLLRRAFALFLPLATLATLTTGLVYGVAQQGIRSAANEPQRQLAEDAARALDDGASPASVLPATTVDVGASLGPFLVVFDPAGRVLATSGRLDGHDPVPPSGVLESARRNPPNTVTWQPRPGVRIAQVTVRWNGGTVLAGRSLREAEARQDLLLQVSIVGGLGILVALAVASFVAAWLWPATPPERGIARSD